MIAGWAALSLWLHDLSAAGCGGGRGGHGRDRLASTITPARSTWSPGAGQRRAGAGVRATRPERREGDGYLLVLVNRLSQLRSDLAILDAQRLNDGPGGAGASADPGALDLPRHVGARCDPASGRYRPSTRRQA